MILNCPSCSTRYLTDPVSFQPNGRLVRCANCGHSWFQTPPDDMPKSVGDTPAASRPSASANVGSARMDPITPFSRTASRRRMPGSTIAVWFLLALGVFGLGTAIYQYRVEIVRGWPQTASLYNLVGVNVNSAGMIFRNVNYDMENQDGMTVLAVTGEVVNITEQDLPIPRVQLVLRDADGLELYHWSITLPEGRIAAEATLPFLTRLSSPPVGAHALEVQFTEGEE